MKEITDQVDFIKIKNIFSVKHQENEKTDHRLGENIYERHRIKDCHPKYTTNSSNNKKTNNPI